MSIMSEITKYELLESIASRKGEIDRIAATISQLEKTIKQLTKQREELRNLNFLDEILLNELYNGTD